MKIKCIVKTYLKNIYTPYTPYTMFDNYISKRNDYCYNM